MKIKITEIQVQKDNYVRQKIKVSRVQEFVRICAGLDPDQEIPKKPTLKIWPFPKVIVGQIILDPKKRRKGFEVIDGHHRLKVAKIFRLKEIDCEIKHNADAVQRYLLQIRTNDNGPLPLTEDERVNAIWRLKHVFKMSLANIAKEFNRHPSQISRIANKKSGWGDHKSGPKTGSHRKNKTASGQKEKTQISLNGRLFTPDQWFDRLEGLLDEYKKEGPQKPYSNYLDKISPDSLKHFAALFSIFEADLKHVLKERIQ